MYRFDGEILKVYQSLVAVTMGVTVREATDDVAA